MPTQNNTASRRGGCPTDTLAYLAGLNDARELSAALLRHCTHEGLAALETVFPGNQHGARVDVTADMVQIAALTLKELCEPQCAHASPVTELGLQALQAVERRLALPAGVATADGAAAGGASCSGRFMQELYPSTVNQVLRARSLCLRALVASVNPANCFTLLSLARRCGVSPLHERALACCLADVACAIAADPVGFASLEQGELVSVLAHDGLRVGAESDVVDALNCWVAQRPAERRPQYAQLLERCVRLGAMSLKELEGLDQHPQTQDCMDVTRLVAHVYVYRIMGLTSPRCEVAGQQPRAMARLQPQLVPEPFTSTLAAQVALAVAVQ